MWVKSIEICGLAHLGKAVEVVPILAELLKTSDTNYRAVFRSQVCLDLTDQAAATMINILQSDNDRSTALLDLQDCRENPNRPALARQQRAAVLKIRDRADVRKVLESAGVIISETITCGDRYGNI
jgi:hypothetical protein